MSDGTIGKNNYSEQFISALSKSGYSQEEIKKLNDVDIEGIFSVLDQKDGKYDGKISANKEQINELIKKRFENVDPKKAEEDFTKAFETYSKEFKGNKANLTEKNMQASFKQKKTRDERLKQLESDWAKTAPDMDNYGKPYKNDAERKNAYIQTHYNTARQDDRIAYENEAADKGLEGNEQIKYVYTKLLNDGLCLDEKESNNYKKILENLNSNSFKDSIDRAVDGFRQGRAITQADNAMLDSLIEKNLQLPSSWSELSSMSNKLSGDEQQQLSDFLNLDEFAQSKIRSAMFNKTHGRADRVVVQGQAQQGGNVPLQLQGGNVPFQPQGGNVPFQPQGSNVPLQPEGSNVPLQPQGSTVPTPPDNVVPVSNNEQPTVSGGTDLDSTIKNNAAAKMQAKQQAAVDYETLGSAIKEAKEMKKKADPATKKQIEAQIKEYEKQREAARKTAGIHKPNFLDYVFDFIGIGSGFLKGNAMPIGSAVSQIYNSFVRRY